MKPKIPHFNVITAIIEEGINVFACLIVIKKFKEKNKNKIT